jgi:hypothetical protein
MRNVLSILLAAAFVAPALGQTRSAAPLGKWHEAPNPSIPSVPWVSPSPTPEIPHPAPYQIVPANHLKHPSPPQAGDICYQFTPDQNVAQQCTNSVPRYCSVGGKFISNIGPGAPTLWSCFSGDGKRSWVISSDAIDRSAWNQ